jgi:lactate racemase
MSPRPGFVLDVDRSTPPTLFWHGERFSLERLPEGSRVIYAPEPLDPLADPSAAIRSALTHPVGDRDPLPALLRPGMRLTIAFDDISLPLPPMERPDIRQMVIEQVLDMAAEAGVDDVALIVALALHRRMTEAELRHALGDRIYDAFAPNGLLTQHDAEDPEALVHLGLTEQGEDVEINRRAAESDLLVYVNINLVAMDGGHKSVATGLASYKSLRHHHNPKTMQQSRSFMDQHRSELHSSNWRMGRLIADSGVTVFQIETTLNNDTFPSTFGFLQKREWEWGARDRLGYVATSKALDRTPPRMARQIFQSIKAPHRMTSVQAGEVEAVHALTTEHVWQQQGVSVEGQTDILTMGLPYISPYNVNSILNPILVACLGLGYFFNLYRGKPLVREGGVLIMSHPTPWEFNPVHHPSYIDFFEQVLTETTDPVEVAEGFEESFATDPWYIHLYRTGHAYHGVHPFYMWYWCAHALQHLGAVIIVGGDGPAVHRLGFRSASTLADALEMAQDVVGRSPSLTHLHTPPVLMADVQ